MPKNEKGSPKDLANRMKSKGLQKLRWFCQMCSKQCRDQNGFKCHMTSESHQRQLLLFGENPGQYLNEFSTTFQKGYLDILRRQYGTKRVRANQVYGEYIRDKEHVHMNATSWHTLTGFVHYLGRIGICKIDHTEKGWYIQYIDREEEEQKARDAKKKKMDMDDDTAIMNFVTKQAELERAKALDRGEDLAGEAGTALERKEGETLVFSLAPAPKVEDVKLPGPAPSVFKPAAKKPKLEIKTEKREKDDKRKTALDDIKAEEERRKEKKNRKDYWLAKDIVVKITTKRLGDRFHKKKGVVTELIDDYTGMVRLLGEGGEVVKLDQAHVETVIPALGKTVLILNGAHRATRATLDAIHTADFAVSLTLSSGPHSGLSLPKVPYEDISKLHLPSD